jgi:phosphomannomutase
VSASGHRFDPSILRDYDIRGIAGRTLKVADAVALGMAFGSILAERGGRTVAVGRDGRVSSPDLAAAVIDGLLSTGVAVFPIGCGPTPMLNYAVATLPADAGIMVTASHNPADHNGFKMTMRGRPFFGADIRELGRRAAAGGFAVGEGEVRSCEVFDAYVDRLAADIRPDADFRVVWDCGNGATGPVAKALTARLPGRHTVLFDAVDGRFPHHHPDPCVPGNLTHLVAAVREEGADIGFAFDGDGDRLGVVDGEGGILWGDLILAFLVGEVLPRHPGAPVIADVKASGILFDEIRRLGGKPVMTRTGHSVIRTRLAELGAPVAGEMSGHIFFADGYYGFDDALYAAVRFLGALAARGDSLASWRAGLPQILDTPEVRIPCDEPRKFAVIDTLAEALAAEGMDFIDIDGVRVETADGWWLLRASNTQAELVARCEAKSPQGLAAAKAAVVERLVAAGFEIPPELL